MWPSATSQALLNGLIIVGRTSMGLVILNFSPEKTCETADPIVILVVLENPVIVCCSTKGFKEFKPPGRLEVSPILNMLPTISDVKVVPDPVTAVAPLDMATVPVLEFVSNPVNFGWRGNLR